MDIWQQPVVCSCSCILPTIVQLSCTYICCVIQIACANNTKTLFVVIHCKPSHLQLKNLSIHSYAQICVHTLVSMAIPGDDDGCISRRLTCDGLVMTEKVHGWMVTLVLLGVVTQVGMISNHVCILYYYHFIAHPVNASMYQTDYVVMCVP